MAMRKSGITAVTVSHMGAIRRCGRPIRADDAAVIEGKTLEMPVERAFPAFARRRQQLAETSAARGNLVL